MTDPPRSHVKREKMVRGHAERLVPMINDLLDEAGLAYGDLTHIAVTVGPGAFTGLRIGLSTARALGVALKCPVCGFSTLESIYRDFMNQRERNKAPGQLDVLVLLDSKRADLYVQAFPSGGPAGPSGTVRIADLPEYLASAGISVREEGLIILGDASARLDGTPYATFCISGYETPDPAALSRYAFFSAGEGSANPAVLKAEPQYLRGADVSSPSRLPRKIEE